MLLDVSDAATKQNGGLRPNIFAGDQYFEVVAGLKAGDEVVTGPYNSVRTMAEGDEVKVEAANRPNPGR